MTEKIYAQGYAIPVIGALMDNTQFWRFKNEYYLTPATIPRHYRREWNMDSVEIGCAKIEDVRKAEINVKRPKRVVV